MIESISPLLVPQYNYIANSLLDSWQGSTPFGWNVYGATVTKYTAAQADNFINGFGATVAITGQYGAMSQVIPATENILFSGQTYTITYRYKVTVASANLVIQVQRSDSPYTNYGKQSLTSTSWAIDSFTFTVTGGEGHDNGKDITVLVMDVGASAWGTAIIDYITVTKNALLPSSFPVTLPQSTINPDTYGNYLSPNNVTVNGVLGVGTTPTSNYAGSFSLTSTATSGGPRGLSFAVSNNPSGTSSAAPVGMVGFVSHDSASNNTGTIMGAFFGSRLNTSATASTVYGGYADVQHYSFGTITFGVGMVGSIELSTSGVVTTGYGFQSALYNSTGFVTNWHGVHINNPSGGGYVGNNIGLFIEDQQAGSTSNNAIELAGSGAHNAIEWNYDTRIYRSASNILKTDGNLAIGSTVSTYNNIATAGLGVPAIYGYGRSTAKTAAVTSVATYTVGASDGSFLVSANVLVTTATVHNFTTTCTYTDESNTSRVLTLSFSQTTGAFLTAITNVTGAGAYEGIPMHIRCKASTSITIATTGTFTTVVYNVEGSITQIS